MTKKPQTKDKRQERGLNHFVFCQGFTLIEVMVTLFIIGFLGLVAGTMVSTTSEDEACIEFTEQVMVQIQEAILGKNTPYNLGAEISGYVADMGSLPDLNDNGQPEALWTKPSGVAQWTYHEDIRIAAGWNGPYLDAPETGFLTDGWGNSLVFTCTSDGTLVITSYGADMKQDGDGVNQDIVVKIRKHHYMGPVGFSFKGLDGDLDTSSFVINYPDAETGGILSKELTPEKFSAKNLAFNLFVATGEEESPVFPIGLRSLTAAITHGQEGDEQTTIIVVPVQPGMNYMGVLE